MNSKKAWKSLRRVVGVMSVVSGLMLNSAQANDKATNQEPQRGRCDGEDNGRQNGMWVAGDFHQHTTYTDGANPFATVMEKNYEYGLDWWANSEHGGPFARDAFGPALTNGFDTGAFARYWDNPSAYPVGLILGTPSVSGGHTNMWRWQSIRDFAFRDVLMARGTYYLPIIQGYEWNVPGHEHCSMAILDHQFGALNPSANAVAQFEYLFDGKDTDMIGGLAQDWTGKNSNNNHAKAVQAVTWLQQNYSNTSYVVFAHPERKGRGNANYVGSGNFGYDIRDFRDFNNAAPSVCFGFESMPGHQKEAQRGGYGPGAISGGTFGGCGAYAAQVGGLWDALLGEGRHWWLFASSDFHSTDADFWPGEYQKIHTYVADPEDPEAIVDGLRSGNGFVVEGDLIDKLDFSATFGKQTAKMGQELTVPSCGRGKKNVILSVWFHSPALNNNNQPVAVDHIDLIAGEVRGLVTPSSPDYNVASNDTTRVIATFNASNWKTYADGWKMVRYSINMERSMYFRLRGANLAPGTPNETDAAGNPLSDTLVGANTADKAWADLWFYSNPIFVKVL